MRQLRRRRPHNCSGTRLYGSPAASARCEAAEPRLSPAPVASTGQRLMRHGTVWRTTASAPCCRSVPAAQRTALAARHGHDTSAPEILAGASPLPDQTPLDVELVVWSSGRLTAAGRSRTRLPTPDRGVKVCIGHQAPAHPTPCWQLPAAASSTAAKPDESCCPLTADWEQTASWESPTAVRPPAAPSPPGGCAVRRTARCGGGSWYPPGGWNGSRRDRRPGAPATVLVRRSAWSWARSGLRGDR